MPKSSTGDVAPVHGPPRIRKRCGIALALLAPLLLGAGCGVFRSLPSLFAPPRASRAAPETPRPQKAEAGQFFRVLTLPTYEMAKEAFDKTAILDVPFHKVAAEFRKDAHNVREATLPDLSRAIQAEVRDLRLGQTSRIIQSREGFSILQKTTSAFYERARRLLERKQDKPALRLLRRELALNPDNLDAWLALAGMMEDMGEMEEAVAAYRKARALAPDNPIVSNKYARYLASQYRYEEAEKILKEAEAKSPRDAPVLLNLASLLVYLNKELDFASRLIVRGAEIDPGRADWYRLSGIIQKRRELGIAPVPKAPHPDERGE